MPIGDSALMIKDLSILMLSAGVIVASVRFLLIPGIGRISAALKFSAKVRGQMIGYATSVPEFTVLVAGAHVGRGLRRGSALE